MNGPSVACGYCPQCLNGVPSECANASDPERAFQELTRERLEELYMSALETIVDLGERLPIRQVTNEPGTSWEIHEGVLAIRTAP